jgi:hypothetical protein
VAAAAARTEGGDGGRKASSPQAAWSDLPQQSQQQQLLGVAGKTAQTAAAATSFVALKPDLQPWPSATGTGQRSLKRTQTSVVPDFGYAEQQNPKIKKNSSSSASSSRICPMPKPGRMMGMGHPGGQAHVKQQQDVELHQALPAFVADTGVSKQQQQQHSRQQQSLQHRGQGHEHVTRRTHWRHDDGEEGQAGCLSRKKLKVRQQTLQGKSLD